MFLVLYCFFVFVFVFTCSLTKRSENFILYYINQNIDVPINHGKPLLHRLEIAPCCFTVTFWFQVWEKPLWSRRRVKLWRHREWDLKAFTQRRSGRGDGEWALMSSRWPERGATCPESGSLHTQIKLTALLSFFLNVCINIELYFNSQGGFQFASRQKGVHSGAVCGWRAVIWKPGSPPLQKCKMVVHAFWTHW